MNDEQRLERLIEKYKNADNNDYWQVLSNKLRMVRDEMIIDVVKDMRFGKVIDFACGLGVISHRLSSQSECVLGIDGAEPAISKAKELFENKKVSFAVGDIEFAKQELKRISYDLLVVTDAFCYFTREQQYSLMKTAFETNVRYLLFEIRAVDPNGADGYLYSEGCDFRTAGEILQFCNNNMYYSAKINVTRKLTKKDILKKSMYNFIRKQSAFFISHYIVDLWTAIANQKQKKNGNNEYDACVLKKRLFMLSAIFNNPAGQYLIEPAISGLALLLKKK